MIGWFVSNKFNTIFKYLSNIATNCGYLFLFCIYVYQPWLVTNLGCDIAIGKRIQVVFIHKLMCVKHAPYANS